MKQKPARYIVQHTHDYRGFQENGWASYSTHLDKAMDYAYQTAARYYGEVFAEYGDGILHPIKSYKRVQKV